MLLSGKPITERRRNLSKYDRSVLALQLESMYADEAKKRQISTLKQNATDTQKSAERGETRDKVAAIAGVSHDTIRKVKIIENEANGGKVAAILWFWSQDGIAAFYGVKPGRKTMCNSINGNT